MFSVKSERASNKTMTGMLHLRLGLEITLLPKTVGRETILDPTLIIRIIKSNNYIHGNGQPNVHDIYIWSHWQSKNPGIKMSSFVSWHKLKFSITEPSYDRPGVTNHRQCDCSFNISFWLTS